MAIPGCLAGRNRDGLLVWPWGRALCGGCKHELEGFLGVRVLCWQCLVKSKLVGISGGQRTGGAWSPQDAMVGTYEEGSSGLG